MCNRDGIICDYEKRVNIQKKLRVIRIILWIMLGVVAFISVYAVWCLGHLIAKEFSKEEENVFSYTIAEDVQAYDSDLENIDNVVISNAAVAGKIDLHPVAQLDNTTFQSLTRDDKIKALDDIMSWVQIQLKDLKEND